MPNSLKSISPRKYPIIVQVVSVDRGWILDPGIMVVIIVECLHFVIILPCPVIIVDLIKVIIMIICGGISHVRAVRDLKMD